MSPDWVLRSRFPRVLDAISKMRRAPRRVLWETEYAILRASLAGRRAKHISAMTRVKDEEEFLYPAVKSIGATGGALVAASVCQLLELVPPAM